jgi:undecaprenyl diphosphate synthase
VRAIERAEAATAGSRVLHLRIAVDYSARDAIAAATALLPAGERSSRTAFHAALNRAIHSDPEAPDVDLLVRTGGEKRLSDFLLWECAYAELVFTERAWPEFGGRDLGHAVEEFRRRERRFGALPAPAAIARS